MLVQAGLCWTCSETTLLVFPRGGSIIFLIYCSWSITPMMYPFTMIFHEPSVAYIFLIVINLFTGITSVQSGFIFQLFSKNEVCFTVCCWQSISACVCVSENFGIIVSTFSFCVTNPAACVVERQNDQEYHVN